MPRGDRTGPLGKGPMTGRGAGFCAGETLPGFANPTLRWGFGRGSGGGTGWGGGGHGWRHRFYATGVPGWAWYSQAWPAAPRVSREQEVDMLRTQSQNLQDALQRINDRLDEIEKQE